MFGSALYFPHIDIRDPVWLRSTLLFWDEIQTIVPSQVRTPYFNEDTLRCRDAGLVRPLHCDHYPQLIEDIGRKIVANADHSSNVSRALRHVDAPRSITIQAAREAERLAHDVDHSVAELTGMHPRRVPAELRELAMRVGAARIHKGKIPPNLRDAFRQFELVRMHPEKLPHILRDLLERDAWQDEDGEWLLMDGRFASAYMAALASKLGDQLSLSPLTHEDDAHGLAFRFMFDDVIDSSRHNVRGTILNLTMRAIRVDASVPIDRVIKFKRARKDQYEEFKAQIEELSAALNAADGDDPAAVLSRAKRIYETRVERGLRQFKRELEQNSITSAWEGAFTAATVSASSTTALALLTGLSGFALLGAAASISAATIGVRGYLAGRKLRISSPYSYLHDVERNFGLPDFV